MRYETKRLIVFCLYPFVWPFGLPSRLSCKLSGTGALFDFSAKFLSLLPGKTGQYVRTAFYKMTLTECHYDLMVGFRSFFTHHSARVGRQVGMGSYTSVGAVHIGDNVMISSRVSVVSEKSGHHSGPARAKDCEVITIGTGCWIGEGAIVMASLGQHCIVSAGSVVIQPAPDRAVAIGNPARFLRNTEGERHGSL